MLLVRTSDSIDSAVVWCKNASTYSVENGGKSWRYMLIQHAEIARNKTLDGLAGQLGLSIN